jgi:hypothetical protein
MAFTEILGKPQDTVNSSSYQILDSLYSGGAVILENATEILTGKKPLIDAGIPLIGFSYKPESGLELLKYQWSQYPYLNKQKLTFSAVKQATDFSVSVISPITTDGPVIVTIALRELLIKLLEKYCNAGGMFTVLTLWGTQRHCVLTGLDGIGADGTMDGTLFKMSFNKPNFDLTGADASMSDFMTKATNGAAI